MKIKSEISLIMSDEDVTAVCIIDATNLTWVPLDPAMNTKNFKPTFLVEMEMRHSDGSLLFYRPPPSLVSDAGPFSRAGIWRAWCGRGELED